MPLRRIEETYVKHSHDRYCQGDILRDISIVEWAELEGEELVVKERSLPYSVIISQDCDLAQDHSARLNKTAENQDKHLQSILLCPAYPSESFRSGEHLKSMGIKKQKINSNQWRQLQGNNLSRYHFLKSDSSLQVQELVIDFKDCITIPRDILYGGEVKKCYLASICALFRENLSIRFTQYLSRIAFP